MESPLQYTNVTSNATTVVKSGQGVLGRIVINKAGASSNIATVYDNTAGSGTKIATIDTTTTRPIDYEVIFQTGLTIVTSAGTAADLTIVWQ